ncbi:hypothetical protein [Thermofilum pendens]|uniref:hypothetical protein n=1 Tax=Thermofilum pendens TaxID=2269 RepID=UPI0000DCF741
MNEVVMTGNERAVAGEAGAEFDEEFIREKIRELLRKALFPRDGYRGFEATHEEVTRELAT